MAQKNFILPGLGAEIDFIQYQNLDFVLSRYNESRPYLEKEMSTFQTLAGPSIRCAWRRSALMLEGGFSWTGFNQSASGTDFSGIPKERTLHMKRQSLFLGFGYAFSPLDRIELVPGLNVGGSMVRINSRVRQFQPATEGQFERLYADFSPYIAPGLKIWYLCGGKRNWAIGPEVRFRYATKTTDFRLLNSDLNPQTAAFDPDSFPQRLSQLSIGLEIRYFLPLGSQ